MTELRKLKLQGVLDTNNSTSTPLGIDGVFTGGMTETLDYGIIYITVHADVASATDGLNVQQSMDGVDWHFGDVFTIVDGSSKTFSINPHARYYRVVYTNGGVAQTHFELQSILKATGKSSAHRIQDSIKTDDDAELVKSVLTGETPNNGFVNFGATRAGHFKVAIEEYGDTPSIDAFDRLRISEPFTIFDSKQLHDKQPLFWDESIGGSATSVHSSVNACTTMSVTTSVSDFVIRQTKQRFNYQAGKSQLILFTFSGDNETAVTKRIGLFDDTGTNNLTPFNGIFMEITGTDISWNIAKNGTTTQTVTQANWNYDKMDGTGVSGVNLDLSGSHIAIIDFEWLGVGRVRVGFVVNGLIYYCHYFNHANDPSFPTVYMTTPNLPLRYSIQSGGSGGSLDHICSTVMSEGGQEQTGILRSINTGTTHLDANSVGTTYALLGIRLKSSYKDITVVPEFLNLMTVTDTPFLWSLQLNPTIAGTFTYGDIANSAVQGAIGATANTLSTSGLVIDSGYVSSGFKTSTGNERKLVTSLRIGSNIGGTLDTLVLCVAPLGANADIFGSITFREML